MRAFKDQPIARKAVILGLAPTLCALVVASLAFLLSVYFTVRRNVIDDVSTSAAIIADSANLAVSMKDAATVGELARALREKANVDRACVYDADGGYLAGFTRGREVCPRSAAGESTVRAGQLHRTQVVTIGGKTVGSVHVVGNLDQLYTTLSLQGMVTVLALAGAAGIALLLIGRLQRDIAQPVSELASTADRVSATNDYSLRATQITRDEVGRLVQSFNAMLEAIERAETERSDLLQREREASRLKDEFLAAVSHELRTPLNAILGWTHILTTTTPSPETLEKGLKTLHRNARAQTRLIEDLIEVSRISTGKLNLKLDVVDLRDVVRQTAEGLQAMASSRQLVLDVSIPAQAMLVSADRDRMLQIVSNLVSNAIKFTPSGGAVIVTLETDGHDFVLRVRDTGIGIAPEFLPFVFERFRQADGSTTREHGGLGLGLSIVYELVQLHHGSVSAHSRGKGQGAEFVVRLPQLVDAPAHPGEPGRRRRLEDARLTGVHVLAVDDNVDSLEIVESTLSAAGATVSRAATGAEALRLFEAERPAVVVCDLAMPGMDGFEVLRRIRQADGSEGRHTWAIALTAYASPEYTRRTREAGFDAHVAKPFDAGQLVAQIAAVMA